MAKLTLQLDMCEKALSTLSTILKEPRTVIVRDASIQRFESTFEIAWKTLKTYLEERHGTVCASPKSAFRQALSVGLLDAQQTEQCLVMTDDRNLTSHTYWEALAQRIHGVLPDHCRMLASSSAG